jgi:putative addiction module component (TIGR02574 family)
MHRKTNEILKKALTLSVEERAELASSLIESLNNVSHKSVSAAWDEEIVGRMDDLDSGRVKPVSFKDARRRLSSLIE